MDNEAWPPFSLACTCGNTRVRRKKHAYRAGEEDEANIIIPEPWIIARSVQRFNFKPGALLVLLQPSHQLKGKKHRDAPATVFAIFPSFFL